MFPSHDLQWNGISILIQHLEDEIYRDRIQTKKGEFYINKKNGIIEQISYFPDGRYFIREKDIDKSKTRCLVFKYLWIIIGSKNTIVLIKINKKELNYYPSFGLICCWRTFLDKSIKFSIFREPDYNNEMTAIATIPLCEDERHLLKRFQLMK